MLPDVQVHRFQEMVLAQSLRSHQYPFLLLLERGITMDEAVELVTKVCAYTNHTILSEALEKWPLAYLEKVVPQLVLIIKELDKRVKAKYSDPKVAIIDENDRVHMAHMDIHYGHSVNGVAYLHTEILKN